VFTKPGSGLWYFGLGDRGNEWWDDPQILACIGDLAKIARERLLGKDRDASEIAVIGSYRSAFYQAFNNLPKECITRQLCENLHRIGAPFDLYLDTDLSNPHFPFDKYRLYIFLNTFYWNDKERALIRERVCAKDRTVVWVWAPGFVSDGGLSVESVKDLTGITLAQAPWMDGVRCVITNYSSPMTRGLPTNLRFGPDRTERILDPLLWAPDPQAEVLGELLTTTSKGGVATFRRPGLCTRKFKGWTSVWSGVPNLPSCLLRSIAREAGVHIYDDADDQVFASERLLAVHARYAGERAISLPKSASVYDPFQKKYVAQDAKEFRVSIPAGGTGLWTIEDIP